MIILEILIIVFIFLGNSIFVLLGWSTINETTSIYKSIHPIFYLLLLYSAFKLDILIKNKFYWRNFLFIISIIIIFRILFQQSITVRLGGNLLIPLLFSFFISELIKKQRSRVICSKWFIGLFLIEASLAIYERISRTLVFPYTLYNPEDINGMIDGDGYFRSNALLGHPLTNALCVAIILSFIFLSNFKKNLKIFLLIIGCIALMCFNARFAMIITFSGFGIYYFVKNKIKLKTIITLAGAALVLIFLIINFNFGDRLLSQGLQSDDTSILARFDVFDMLNYFDYSLIFVGSGLEFVELKLGMLHIENWILIMVFDLGVMLTIYYVFMITKLSLLFLGKYTKVDKYYLFLVFILIATSNNSLASQSPAICFFIASCIFIPHAIQTEVARKKNDLNFNNNGVTTT
jgi:hypothetical protein